jgi:hypothetical protein
MTATTPPMTTILPEVTILVKIIAKGRRNPLNKNLNSPSKVCARPDIIVPTAERAVLRTSKRVLNRVWNTARIEVKMALIAPKIEETKLPKESTREGMIAVDLFILLVVRVLGAA